MHRKGSGVLLQALAPHTSALLAEPWDVGWSTGSSISSDGISGVACNKVNLAWRNFDLCIDTSMTNALSHSNQRKTDAIHQFHCHHQKKKSQ
jgi:hypothetical protein